MAQDLTPKQQRFVDEYLVDLNSTRAAIRAGYSAKTAEQQGSRLFRKVEISAAIAEAMQERSRKTKIDAAWVLREAEKLYGMSIEVGDVKNAKGCLDLIGKHTNVQAFKDVVKHEGEVQITVSTGVSRAPDD